MRVASIAAMLVALASLADACPAIAQTTSPVRADERAARRELAALRVLVPHFGVLTLAAKGEQRLTPAQSLTVDDLRGVRLDAHPPVLGPLAEPYDPNQTDGYAPDLAPYVARGIAPFRLRAFTCEFNYGGWHNLAMQDYAATHGFGVIYPYVRKLSQRSRMLTGTKWLKWGGFVNWDEWLPKHGIAPGRYDLLDGMDVEAELTKGGLLGGEKPSEWDYLMIDMEHGVLQPTDLRKQAWYPSSASDSARDAFERRYYRGYARTIAAPMAAAKRLGYRNTSVYGWEPFPRTWWGLDKFRLDPASYGPWQLYGRAIHDDPATDILNPSLYVFYWSAQNVASTICNLDFNRELVETAARPKPIRPYYWTLLHGGDDRPHWWSNQPVPNEEARAWTFLGLMSGVDGFDLWNWSGTDNHHIPRPLLVDDKGAKRGSDICVKDGFQCRREGAGPGDPPAPFARYDFIHVLGVDETSTVVRFRKIEPDNWRDDNGLRPDQPVFAMPREELTPHLRAESDPVSGVVEGMALAKPLEYTLSHGRPAIDVSSLSQFLEALPIVRRTVLGRFNVIATYDPKVVYGGRPREIVLKDFAGRKGRTLRLPADGQVRVWVLDAGKTRRRRGSWFPFWIAERMQRHVGREAP